jgi:hypothetical protein
MAAGALLVDSCRLARHQRLAAWFVYGMTRRATHLVIDVAALDAARVGRFIQMAGEAGLAGFRRRKLSGIPDIVRGSRFGVFTSGAMAGFARLALPPAFLSKSTAWCGLFPIALKKSS